MVQMKGGSEQPLGLLRATFGEIAAWPSTHEPWRAVMPPLFAKLTKAPRSRRSRVAAACPKCDAAIRGVNPLLFVAFTKLPSWSSRRSRAMRAVLPFAQASMSNLTAAARRDMLLRRCSRRCGVSTVLVDETRAHCSSMAGEREDYVDKGGKSRTCSE